MNLYRKWAANNSSQTSATDAAPKEEAETR